MNVFQLLWCVSVLIQTVVHVLYLFGIFKYLILNPHQFMLCPQHTLSRCGRVGPQIFMRKPITHPCLPTRFPPVCMTFLSSSVRLTTPFFASSWKAIPTQTNLVDRSPQHGEKECVVRVNSRVIRCSLWVWSFSHMSVFSKAQSFDDFIGDMEVAIWRLFYVCCFPFFSRRSGVDQGHSLCCGVRGARRF